MLNITKHKNNHIELHLGTYFRGFISTLSGFFLMLISASIIIILAKGLIPDGADKAITLICLFIFFGIFLNLFLGFEGVEFDLEKKEFRHYVKRLGIKVGKWKDLKAYSMLCLSAQYNRGIGRTSLSVKRASHRSLEINLASLTKEAVLLAECKNYDEAEKTIHALNKFLQLEIKNFVMEDYLKPSPKR